MIKTVLFLGEIQTTQSFEIVWSNRETMRNYFCWIHRIRQKIQMGKYRLRRTLFHSMKILYFTNNAPTLHTLILKSLKWTGLKRKHIIVRVYFSGSLIFLVHMKPLLEIQFFKVLRSCIHNKIVLKYEHNQKTVFNQICFEKNPLKPILHLIYRRWTILSCQFIEEQ